MYKEFYGLRDIPFSLAPDPKYLFRTDSLLEVFANLQYGIESGKGLVVVTGEVGTGKTTILRSMLQSLDRSVLPAYIFNPLLTTEDFFDLISSEFRIGPQKSKATALRLLGNALMSRHSQGFRTVLVVDEAHLLPHSLLEEIRLLSNFETNREKLLQVILCGQPELHDLMAKPELRQLKQRVSLKCSIKSLTAHETSEYIRWRLRIAGCKNETLFESEAIGLVHRFSAGIPRIINNICDNALISGFADASPRITAAIIQDVVAELDLGAGQAAPFLTVGESIAARQEFAPGSANSHKPESSNVEYIRRDPSPAVKSATAGSGSFVISSERDSDSEAPLTFFSRVRVSRSS